MPVSKISTFERQILELGRIAVDRPALGAGGCGRLLVDRVAEHVPDPAQRDVADGNRDRAAGVDDLGAARETVGGVHGDRADAVVAEVLLHLGDQLAALRARDR